jgi:hypothetical protein
MKPATVDPFEAIFTPGDEARAGLASLSCSRPLWPDVDRWTAAITAVIDFEGRWGARARAAGWSNIALYGLSRTAPYADLSRMGAAWLAARDDRCVTAVDGAAIHLTTRTAARLRIFRSEPDEGAVLPWQLVRER